MKSRDLITVRALTVPAALLSRAAAAQAADPAERGDQSTLRADGDAQVMVLRFSAFGVWYEINSWYEGRFLERVLPGAFTKTIAERGDRVKILFNHGTDFFIGDKILGVPEVLEERSDGAYAEVPLLDTSYNRDLIPGLAAKGYGSSFMFNVTDELWNYDPEPSEHNPDGLPERSILQVRLFEAGPVTWPASHAATAGLRSIGMTDWYGEQLRSRDRDRHEALVRSFTDFRDKHGLRTSGGEAARADADPVRDEPGTAPQGAADSPTDAPDTPVVHHASGLTPSQRGARFRAQRYPFLTKEAS
ncbi:HK97 family phage prohead protease [Microbispora sp. NPDC004025]